MNLDSYAQRVREALQSALEDEAELILAEAIKIVPIEEGSLQDSGMTASGNLEVAIGFGSGPAAPYAVRQHEELTFAHDAGRQAKYLETPFVAAQSTLGQNLAEGIRRNL